MTLKIQEFIRTHPNWKEELSSSPYNLRISEDDGFFLFKYSQIDSDFNEEICREARGLILDSTDNFKVVRFAFKKFFNLGEQYADDIDWDNAVGSDKIDGSLMTLWYARGKWRLSSSGTVNAFKAALANSTVYKTFGELFDAAATNDGLDIKRLNPNHNYTFELVSPYNQVVLSYPKPSLYHISTRRMDTLEEIEEYIGIQKPKCYNLNSETEYQDLVSQMGDGHEGIVVRDKEGNRVKIKTKRYFELHRLHNNGQINLERIVDLIQENDYEELLCYYPQYTDYVMKIKKRMEEAGELVAQIVEQTAQWKNANNVTETNSRQLKGCFAQLYKKNKYSALYFLAYDNKIMQIFATAPTKRLISLLHLDENENEKE